METHKIVVTVVYREGRKIVERRKKEIDLNEIDYMEFRLNETFIHLKDRGKIEIRENEKEFRDIVMDKLKDG